MPLDLETTYRGQGLTARIEADGTVTWNGVAYDLLSTGGSRTSASDHLLAVRRTQGRFATTGTSVPVLDSDLMALVDGISWHPLYSNRADEPYYQTYPDLVREMKAEAEAHGFRGVYLPEEMTWRTAKDIDPTFLRESAAVAVKYFVRTIVLHRGLDTVPIIAPGALDWTAIGNTDVLLAGATPTDLSVRVETAATHLRQYSFALPDGSHLVALWTDWLPVEKDPGVAATVTIDGLGGSTPRRSTS